MTEKNKKDGVADDQTHFIGVLLPEGLTRTFEDCRRYMSETYGCSSGHGAPIHVTIVPPFRLKDELSTKDLEHAIEANVVGRVSSFIAHIINFDAFEDRTLYAKVIAGERWNRLREASFRAILHVCPGCVKKDRRPFQPHISIANRDIPQHAVSKAKLDMNKRNIVTEFPVDNITIFERESDGGWKAAASIHLSGIPK